MAAPISSVVGFPPMAGVRAFDRAKVSAIASSTASAASEAPRCLSIIAPDHICPMGFAMPLPAISGAEPWTGSNMDGYSFSGFRFAEGAMPIDPTTAGPRSERMSPKRFEPTTTSNRSEEHTSELQSQSNLVCRLLLEKNKENVGQPLFGHHPLLYEAELGPLVSSSPRQTYTHDDRRSRARPVRSSVRARDDQRAPLT